MKIYDVILRVQIYDVIVRVCDIRVNSDVIVRVNSERLRIPHLCVYSFLISVCFNSCHDLSVLSYSLQTFRLERLKILGLF